MKSKSADELAEAHADSMCKDRTAYHWRAARMDFLAGHASREPEIENLKDKYSHHYAMANQLTRECAAYREVLELVEPLIDLADVQDVLRKFPAPSEGE